MPRRDRQETVYNGSTHHVIQRGINRTAVFMEAQDYKQFKCLMRRYLRRFDINIYNYCLMPNHIHILLYVKEKAHLPKFMQALLLAYSWYYRGKYNYSGYLWQGRYKNFLIEKDSYLLECARYIERNPLRTDPKIVNDPSDYKWSSYNFYSKGIKDNLITVNPLFETLGKTPEERQLQYKEYILISRPYEEALDDIFCRGEVAPKETDPPQ